MAIQIADNFTYQGKKPLDARIVFNTLADMVATSSDILYDGCLAYVKGNKKYYTYDSSNDVDETLGKWRELETGTSDEYIPKSQKGANGGVAELDANGKIPVSQIPNGFDNVDYGTAGGVVETASGYTATSFTKTGESSPVAPRTDTIYLDTTLNISFMWGGENYISVGGGGVALGETSSTAYRGDRGKKAYDDSQTNKTAIGTLANLTTTEKTNLVGAINEIDNALDGKVNAVTGKGLSTNDYTDADKTVVGGVTSALNGKVDKVSGKGLSTNDYDNDEKQKVAKAQPKLLATPIVVDETEQTTVEGALNAINSKSTGSGHTIQDEEGTSMTARKNLQFVGATVTDDSTNNKTVVEVSSVKPITNAEIDAMWNGTYNQP